MLKNKKQIRHIFLDVGDTLLFLGIPPGAIYLDVLRRHGILKNHHIEADLKTYFTEAWNEMNSKPNPDWKDRYRIHPHGQDGWWKELISLFLQKVMEESVVNLPDNITKEIFDKFENESLWEIEPSFFVLQEYAHKHKIGLGVISNWDYRLRGLLERKNLIDYFSPILISAEFGYEKPSEVIFQRALELSGREAEELIYVGDKPELDYFTPVRLGWNAFVIGAKKREDIPYISTLSDLITIIEGK
jgi:2-haloacid dehalogenase